MGRVIDKLPEDEETREIFEDLENRLEEAERNAQFDINQFRSDVREFIKKYQSEYKKENKEFINYILATNEKVDKMLKRIKDKGSFDRVVSKMQK